MICIKEHVWGWMSASTVTEEETRYKHLSRDEEIELEMKGSAMDAAFYQLWILVEANWKQNTNFGKCFADARERVEVIRNELLNQEGRKYIYAPQRYLAARAQLDEGLRLLCASEQDFQYARNFELIKEQVEYCQKKMDDYAAAWNAIREFDANNSNPYWQRAFGRDAFSQKASMVEMLRELRACV